MRLISLHADTVEALQRLHMPFDDLTPEGLWGTPYHLVGVSPEQRDVLKGWNIEFEEITPAAFARAAGNAAESLSYANENSLRNGARLRTSYRGRYMEGTVQGGKILIDGKVFDTPAHASRGIHETDRAFWEFFDDGAGQWQVLDRNWQTA